MLLHQTIKDILPNTNLNLFAFEIPALKIFKILEFKPPSVHRDRFKVTY